MIFGINKDILKAIMFALVGTACFTPIFAAGKLSGAAVPVLLVIFMRFLGGFASVVTLAVVTKTPVSKLRSANLSTHILRSCLALSGAGLTIFAATHLRLAEATAIGLLEGLIIIGLAALLLGEHVRRAHWFAGLLCASGAYIVLFGDSGFKLRLNDEEMLGAMAALAGAVLLAIETLVLKIVARRDSALGVIMHVTGISTLILMGPAVYVMWQSQLTLADLLPLIWIGPLATIGQLFNIKAYRLADVSILGPVNYSWILFATLFGFVMFGEIPGVATLVGGIVICIGGAALARIPPLPADPSRSILRFLPSKVRS